MQWLSYVGHNVVMGVAIICVIEWISDRSFLQRSNLQRFFCVSTASWLTTPAVGTAAIAAVAMMNGAEIRVKLRKVGTTAAQAANGTSFPIPLLSPPIPASRQRVPQAVPACIEGAISSHPSAGSLENDEEGENVWEEAESLLCLVDHSLGAKPRPINPTLPLALYFSSSFRFHAASPHLSGRWSIGLFSSRVQMCLRLSCFKAGFCCDLGVSRWTTIILGGAIQSTPFTMTILWVQRRGFGLKWFSTSSPSAAGPRGLSSLCWSFVSASVDGVLGSQRS
jgi:hypothetical protein